MSRPKISKKDYRIVSHPESHPSAPQHTEMIYVELACAITWLEMMSIFYIFFVFPQRKIVDSFSFVVVERDAKRAIMCKSFHSRPPSFCAHATLAHAPPSSASPLTIPGTNQHFLEAFLFLRLVLFN